MHPGPFKLTLTKKEERLKQKVLLTQREQEVMALVKKGLSNKMIADQLNISAETVKKHLQNIFAKLEAGNKIEAINKMDGVEKK